jgi:phage gpG-like protein
MGHLVNSFTSSVSGNEVEIKSIEPYAATHQYGDNRSITRKTKKGSSKPYNRNIPARPFMGVNEEDKVAIVHTVVNYLEKKYGTI